MKWLVTFTLQRTITIEADSEEDANDVAFTLINHEDIWRSEWVPQDEGFNIESIVPSE